MGLVRIEPRLKPFRECGALADCINAHGFLGPLLLTKSGDVVAVLRASGADAECLEPSTLDYGARRLESALRAFDERFIVYQYHLKRSRPEIPSERYVHPAVDEAVSTRWQSLQARGERLYEVETYFVVLRKPDRKQKMWHARPRHLLRQIRTLLREGFSVKVKAAAIGEALDATARDLRYKLDNFTVQAEAALKLTLLTKEEAFSFFRRLLNPDREKADAVRLKYDVFTDYFIPDSSLECHRSYLRLDDYYLKLLTMKELPAQSFANMLANVHASECEFILVSEWRVASNARAQRIIRSKRRHFHNSKVSMLSYVGEERPAAHEILVDDSKQAMVDDLGSALREMEAEGKQFGEYSLTVMVLGKDLERVEHGAAQFVKAIGAHDGAVNEERYNLLNAFRAALPGGYDFNLRRLWVSNANHADFSFLFRPDAGERVNAFLQREYLFPFETLDRTLYFYNLHYEDVAHTFVIGTIGSGKTFLLNNLILHLQKYDPHTLILDLGGGYEWLTSVFGGTHVKVTVGRQPFTANIFCLAPTKENLQFIFAFVKVLIESRGQHTMTGAEDRDLYEAVESIYVLEPNQRRLLTLSGMLKRPLAQHLQRWVEGGQYGELFDNVEDTLTFSRFQSFDFEGLERYPETLEPRLFYILYRASSIVYDTSRSEMFTCWIDEAWRFLRHPVIRQFITEALKTWRKKNAAMILATQSTDDLSETEMVRHVVENCPTKLFLANPNMDEKTYRELLALNATELRRIRELVPKRQLLLKRPNLAKVLELNVDPKTYWLCTTNPHESVRRREAVQALGLRRALQQLANEE